MSTIDFQTLFESAPGLYLILTPELKILTASDSYLQATMTKRESVVGRHIFEVFPDNPGDESADGVSNLRASLYSVLRNRVAHTMAVQKYDIRRPDGTFEVRFWSPMNKPLLNAQQEVKYIIHRVEDVTDFMKIQNEQERKDKIAEDLLVRIGTMEMEIFKRAQEIQQLNSNLEKQVVARSIELIKTEQQFRKSLDSLMEGIQIIDRNWRYVYVNDALALHGKTTKENLIGFTMMERYPGIENTEVFKTMEQCMNDRTPRHFENEFVYPDKTHRWFELSIQPVEQGIFVLSLDITARKEAEEKVNRANRLYAFISQINQQIVHVQDEKTLLKNCCDIAIEFGKFKIAWIGKFSERKNEISLIEQSGIAEKDLPKFTPLKLHSGGPQDIVLKSDSYFVCNDLGQGDEMKNLRDFAKENNIRSCMVLPIVRGGKIVATFNLYAGELDFFKKEEILLMQEVTGDISFAMNIFDRDEQRKEAEKALLNSESNMRTIFENTTSGFLLLDAAFNIVSFNKQISHFAINAFGFDMKVNSNFVEMVLPERKEPFRILLESILRGESMYQEVNYPDPDGNILWYRSTSSRILDRNGEAVGICLTVDNITDRKKAEAELELQNKELIKTNSELDRFVYSVSHDLHSPLTSVLGLVSFIEEESKEKDTLEHAGMIRSRITRLDGFIRNILSYSRNNRMEIVREQIQVEKTIREVIENLRRFNEQKDVVFEVDVDDKTAFYSDAIRMHTVLENLISNSIKYQDPDKHNRWIKIKATTSAKDLKLEVEDNGVGIEAENIEKIFRMFYRVSGKVPGSGLGLYIVKEVVGKLGGTVTCNSVAGKGTSFVVHIKNMVQ